MTNKKEIIDGVNVSECIFHSVTTMGHAGYNYCKCSECACECHNDCYYKQLKRKEQECEELKRVKDNFFKHAEISHEAVLNKNKIIDEQEKQLDQLKVENEELKKKIKYMEEYIKTVENSRNEFEKESKFLKEEIQKL